MCQGVNHMKIKKEHPLEGFELKGPDVEIKSINKEPVAIAIEGKDNKQE